MRTGLRALALAMLGACVAAPHAVAGEKTHTVRPGESASSIAKRYYGEVELAGLLLRYNDKPGTVIHPGERLRVPYCEVHVVKPGDALSVLAKRYLGRASLHPALAELNGRSPEQPLRVGERLVIPVVVSHRLERGDTLATLAERFYGDLKLGHVLQSFNGIEDPRRMSVGQTVQVPLVSLQLREEVVKRPAAASPPKEPVSQPPAPEARPLPRFPEEIRSAKEAFHDGDYDRARDLLESLRGRIGSSGNDAEKTEFWRLLSFVYVAFDLHDEACAAYRSQAELSAGARLDPDLVSPKIRTALSECGGARASVP